VRFAWPAVSSRLIAGTFGALLALIVTAGITLSMGQGIRLLVDQGFMTQSPHLLNQSIGLFMLLVLGLAVGTFARFYLVSWIGERCVADIRRQVFNHLIYLHPGSTKTTAALKSSRGDRRHDVAAIGDRLFLVTVSAQPADGDRRYRPAVCDQPQTHQHRGVACLW
jgi:ABC-type multidrug transport system fused ATPase/permease subunit